MTNITLLLIVGIVAIIAAIALSLIIIIDTLIDIRERFLMFLEKHFSKYYYYDYEDERRE